MYRSGELNRKIRIERDRRVDDGIGGHKMMPVLIACVWAKYRDQSGGELLRAQQVQSTTTGLFIIRNRDDLLPRDRIVMGQTKFNILKVPPFDSRASFLEIPVESGVAS